MRLRGRANRVHAHKINNIANDIRAEKQHTDSRFCGKIKRISNFKHVVDVQITIDQFAVVTEVVLKSRFSDSSVRNVLSGREPTIRSKI